MTSSIVVQPACTTESVVITNYGDAGTNKLPSVGAKDLGGKCSGYGTGVGQTAAFDDPDCPAALCLVDAREGLDLYCSADCTKVACPKGYSCEDVQSGDADRACFKSGASAGDDDDDAPAEDTLASVKLTGFRASSSTKQSISVAELVPSNAKKGDKVLLVLGAPWDPYSRKLLDDMASDFTIAKVRAIVVVAIDGFSPGKGMTEANFVAFHQTYSYTNMLLDSRLEKLSAVSSLEYPEGIPTIVGLDAITFDILGETTGYSAPSDLEATVNTWKTK